MSVKRWPLPVAVWLTLLLTGVFSCGRSDSIGWADREPPDSASRVAEGTVVPREEATRLNTGQDLRSAMREYRQLARMLEPLRVRALGDSSIAAQWEILTREVDTRVVQKNPFAARLLGRQQEIEQRIQEAERTGDSLSQEESAKLARHWRNIGARLGAARNRVFQEPAYRHKLRVFQDSLYTRMRELEPDRAPAIDRMIVLRNQLIEVLDSVAPALQTQPRMPR